MALQEYKFKFNKRGLDPNEFEDCLTSKVDGLLQSTPNIPDIERLKISTIKDVRSQVCIRENRANTGSLFDFPSEQTIGNYRQENNLRNRSQGQFSRENRTNTRSIFDFPFERARIGSHRQENNLRNRGQGSFSRRQRKKEKQWHKEIHEEQYKLFTVTLGKEFKSLFPDIEVSEHRKGYLFSKKYYSENPLSTKAFCKVIDKISAEFLSKLEGSHDTQLRSKLESVSQSCQRILKLRIAADWSIDNDLMDRESCEVWKAHVMVIISFAALMVVAEMIINRRNGVRDIIRILFLIVIFLLIGMLPQGRN